MTGVNAVSVTSEKLFTILDQAAEIRAEKKSFGIMSRILTKCGNTVLSIDNGMGDPILIGTDQMLEKLQ